MLLSPNPRVHLSVLFILTVCVVSAALAGIYKFLPAASASTSRETSVARRAIETSAPAPVSATIVVNSNTDVQNNSDGLCTLREAITAANTDTASGPAVGECVAGSGSDTIDLTGLTGTVTLTSVLPFIVSDVTLSGPGASKLTVARSTAGGTARFGIFGVLGQGQSLTVNMSGLRITNGHTADVANAPGGAGIWTDLSPTVNLTNMVIEGNTTGNGGHGSGGGGGGIWNFCAMTITGSTINGNTTGNAGTDPGAFGGYGGGIYNAGTLTLINTTVSGNTAGEGMNSSQGGYGGGIFNTIGRTVTLINSTVSDNGAGSGGLGGGIRNEGTANLKDTIVANNAVSGTGTGPDLSGSFNSQDFNLIENVSGTSFTGVTTHNITGVDPLLGPLGAYGGTTLTHPLLFGSPAIDAANSSLLTDQRGQPRPIDDINAPNATGGNVTDIGAFEAHLFEVNSTADTSDGQCTGVGTGNGCTLREAITAANSESGAELITFAPALTAGGPASITLDNTLPNLMSDMLIIGPGSSQLTVRRSTAGGTPEFRVFTIDSGVTISITGLTIADGKLTGTNNGGGILNQGALMLTSCDLYGNSVDQSGGAIYSNGTSLTITDCQIGGLSAGQPNTSISTGAGIYNLAGVLSITGGSVVGNSNGGGVFVAGGSATLNGTRVTNNSDFGGGGGVTNLNAGTTTTVVNSLIATNSAPNGAGVYNQDGTMHVANSTISGNTSTGAGGGARNQSGTLTLTNVTVTNNRTTNAGLSSGGISVSGTVHLRNTIVAGNFRGDSPSTTAGDISGSVSFGNSLNNLIGTGGSGGLINGVNGNRVGVFNPGLGLLANNGGLTETHALLVGSLALDGGNNIFVTNPPFSGSAPFFDQRGAGFKRILDAADTGTTQTVDIGAYEANPMIADIPNTTVNEDASITCLAYNVGDETEGFSSIVATSTNQSLVQDANLNPNLPNGSGSRCLAIGLEPNQFGSSTIAVTLTGNNGLVISDSFLLTVNAVGDAPSVTAATTNEDTPTSSGLVITKNPADGSEVTQFYITSIQNGTLYQNNGVTQIFNNSFITLAEGGAGLKFTPAANLNSPGNLFGFTVQAATSAGFSSVGPGTNASITVNPVNDPPSFTKGSDLFVNQQPGGYTIPNWATNISAGAPNESGQVLTFEVTGNTNSALFSVQPAVNSAGTLTFTGAANTTGTSTITIHLEDNGGGTDTSPSQTFSITITPPPITPVVNMSGDAADINIGDRVCDSDPAPGNQCTLRAALQETNATGAGSGNAITFSLPSPSTITLASALPDINTTLTVTGPGASSLTVQRGSGAPNFRIFTINGLNLVVSISGLTIANGSLTGTSLPTSSGAGIYTRGTLTLTNVTLSGNNAGVFGGAISNDGGSLTINSCLLTNNVSGGSGGGGGLYTSGTANLTNVTVTGNTATHGGGIYNTSGSLTVTNTTISANVASGGSGGGIFNTNGSGGGPLTITSSTISNNSASAGGGVYNAGIASITNSTLSANNALAGGGIQNINPLTLINVTIANNSAANAGGGMYNPGIGVAIINNSMLAANTSPSGPDCSCANLSGDYNLYSNTSGATVPGTHNVTNTAALLGPLANNGGLTQTHPLLVGSPAIDAGNTSQTTDQRGQPRPIDDPTVTNAAGGNGTDIGAFEAHNLQVNTVLDTDDGSCTSLATGNGCSLREAMTASNAQIGMESISFASALTAGGAATITLTTALPAVNSDMMITGPGANLLSIQRSTAGGTPNFRIFTVASMMTVNISGMTITNGRTADGLPAAVFGNPGDPGGGIMNSGFLTLANMTITGNRTGNGAVPSSASSVGTAFGGPGGLGGGIYSSGQLTMSNVTVSNNTTGEGASAYYGGGGGRGGGIFIISGSLTMTNCVVSGNVTGNGAIGTTSGASSGTGGGGGGINIQVGTTTITNTSIINNTTGTTQVASPSNSGSGGEGGGITIASGTSVDSGSITIVNSTINGNRTGDGTGFAGQAGGGAGLYNNSSSNLTIIGTTISGNQTGNGLNTGEAGIGAGLTNAGTTKIINSTISGNITGTGNLGGGSGAGIWNAKNLFLTNSSVVFNANGGVVSYPGIHQINSASAVTLRNTIIAGNTYSGQPNAPDLSGGPAYNSQGNNLIGNADGASGFSTANGDQLGTTATPLNPRLAVLGNYGGPTQTHALLPGSPALDAGNNCVTEAAHCSDPNISQLTTDQRGINRVVNSTVDIGSFESRGFTFSATSGTPQSTVIGSTFAQPLVATVSSAFAEPVAGALITFAAPASGASGTFSNSATTVTVSANSSGVASQAFIANRTAGSYNVVASLAGGSPSANFSLTNSQAPTNTFVFSSVNPSEFGQNITFSAAVGSNVAVPSGTVQFKDGLTNLGSPVNCAISPPNACYAEFSTSTLSVGSHTISATYSGDANFLSSSGTMSGEQVVKAQPTLSIEDVSITEGNSGTADLTFTVTLSAASNLTVNVNYTTADGTATVADGDYQLKSGAVTFNPGEPLSKTITVLVNGDQKTESDETVFVVLSNPVNAAFSDSQGQGTILNDDTLQLLLDTSGPDANQLAALDSFLLIRDPFPVLSAAAWWNLGADQNTRVLIFASNLTLNPGENVLVTLVDGTGQTPPDIAAEDVRALPDSNFTQIRFRLPDGLLAGNCLVTIKAQGRTSNTGIIRIAP